MKNKIHIIGCFIILALANITINAQEEWPVSIFNVGQLDGRVEGFLDQVQVTINNTDTKQRNVILQITISNGSGLIFDSEPYEDIGTFDVLPSPMTSLYTVRQIFDTYGLSIDDINSDDLPPGYEDYIQEQRRLPPDDYTTCIYVKDAETGLLLGQRCFDFNIELQQAPTIQVPQDISTGVYLTEGPINVSWIHNNASLTNGLEYQVLVKRFENHDALDNFDKEDHSAFEALPDAVYPVDMISGTWTTTILEDDFINLNEGDFIAIRVQVVTTSETFINQGKSNIVIAAYGVSEDMLCEHPTFPTDVVWPEPGDTLPFRDLHYVVRFDPLCDNLKSSEVSFTTSDREATVSMRTDRTNTWPNGPLQFLQNFADNSSYSEDFILPDPSYAQHLPLLHPYEESEDFRLIPNESGYKLSAHITYYYDDLRTGSSSSFEMDLTEYFSNPYHVGMPRPNLQLPLHDDIIPPGSINLSFNTGNRPNTPLPPFQLMKISGNQVTNPYLNVKEKCVLQVSQDSLFTRDSIVFDGLRTIMASSAHPDIIHNWEDPNFSALPGDIPIEETDRRLYREEDFLSQVYKDGDMTFIHTEEDTLFWRVVWLLEPETINEQTLFNNGIYLDDNSIYNTSEVRRLIISNNDSEGEPLAEDDSPIEENTPTTCSTGCNPELPTEPAATNISDRTSIKVGYFAVTDIEQSGGSTTSITGTGVITIPFLNSVKIKVDLSNVTVTEEGKVLSGTIKAHEDTSPFDLSTINADVASAASTIPSIGTVNNWLQENVPEGRIVTALVSGDPVGMPLGFDREINGHNLLIGITDMHFTPEGATIKILYEHQFDKLGEDQYISLRGDICLKPSGFGAEVMLSLNRDFAINDFEADSDDENDIDRIVFKGSNSSDLNTVRSEATHIAFHCACVKSMGIQMEATLNEDRFIKDYEGETPPADSLAKMRFGILLRRDVACNVEDLPENIPVDSIRANNFMISLDMDDFQYKKFDGWSFRVDEAYVDLSDLENPASIVFPTGYDHSAVSAGGALLNTWTGFYLKELSVKAPEDFYDNNDNRNFKAGVKNVIIDRTGFTLDAVVENIVSVDTGSVGGWAFSLDEFKLSIVQSTFRSGSISGEIGVPIMKPGDNMDYDAILSYTPTQTDKKWGFFLNIEPEGELQLPPVLGTASLNDNSYIAYTYGYVPPSALPTDTPAEVIASKKIALKFAGNLNIDSEDEGFAGQVGSLASTIGFSGVDFALGYSDVRGFYEHDFSFASPQKMMGSTAASEGDKGLSGFPVTIKDWDIESNFGDGRCIGATLSITPEINFMGEDEGGLKASTEIRIPCEYNTDTKRFRLKSPTIGEVCFGFGAGDSGGKSEQNGITLEGCIEFYKNATRCDVTASGVKGNLRVGTPVAEVVLNAEFGSTSDFRYFFVDGKATFQNGLPLGSLQLLGIGGGFYYNMTVDNPGTTGEYNSGDMDAMTAMHGAETIPDGNPVDTAAVRRLTVPSSGLNPCPQDGARVFKLLLPIATAGDPSAFNMDVSTLIQVERGRGVTYFNVLGDGYIMADIPERPTAPIKADIIIEFSKPDPTTKIFHGGFDLYVDFEYDDIDLTIEGLTKQRALDGRERSLFVGAHFNYEKRGSEDAEISFKMGSPHAPGGINIDLLGFIEVEGRHYMQAGNNIDYGFMEKPQLIRELLNESKSSTEGEGGSLTTGTLSDTNLPNNIQIAEGEEVSGFNMGLSLEADIDLDMFLIYASLRFAVGFDLSVANLGEGSYCFTPDGGRIQPVGADGWYTTGQIYAGLEGEVGLQIKLIRTRRFALFRLGAAVSLQGGFPRPTWAEGKAGVRYSVLGGLISGQANLKVSAGTKCIPPRTSPFDFDIIDELKPEGGEISPFFSAQASFVVPIGETLNIPVLDEDGNVLRTDYVKPIMDPVKPFEIIADGVNQSFASVEWSEDRTICTVTPSEPLPLANVKFKVNVQAKEWKNGSFQSAKIDNKVWKSSKETTFNTTDLPELIDNNLIDYCMPVMNQNFHLQDDRKESIHRVKFDRNLKTSYFYTEKDGINYKYIARYEPYNSGEHIDANVTISSTGSVNIVDEPTLDNNTIYNFSIIRKEEAFQDSDKDSGLLGFNPAINVSNLPENARLRLKSTIDMNFLQNQYNGSLSLLSQAKTLQPGQKRSHIETIILSYNFKTSKYNTLTDKLETSNSEYQQDFYSGDIPTYALEIYAQEHFDLIDVFGNKHSGGQPLVGIFPDADNPTYRYSEDIRFYSDAANTINGLRINNTSKLPPFINSIFKVEVDIRAGMAAVFSRNKNIELRRFFDLPTIMNTIDFNVGFNGGGYDIAHMQPFRLKNIHNTHIIPLLTQHDVDYAWETYLNSITVGNETPQSQPDTDGENNETNLLGNLGFTNISLNLTGLPNFSNQNSSGNSSIGGPISTFNNTLSVGSGIVTNSIENTYTSTHENALYKVIVADYNIGAPITQDYYQYYNNLCGLYLLTRQVHVDEYDPIFIPLYKAHMIENFRLTSGGQHIGGYIQYLYNERSRYTNNSLKRGTYRFSINHLLFDADNIGSYKANDGKDFQFTY